MSDSFFVFWPHPPRNNKELTELIDLFPKTHKLYLRIHSKDIKPDFNKISPSKYKRLTIDSIRYISFQEFFDSKKEI